MALDEPRENDDIYEYDGVQYLVDKEFLKKADPIKVDFNEIGFQISSNIQLQSGCGGGCGTGSCG